MRYFFLLVGLLLIVASLGILFVRPNAEPKPVELLAFLFMVGGFVLLGVAQILKTLSELKSGKS